MTLTVDAVYENGVLRPTQPLPFKDHEKVRLTVQSATERPSDDAEEIVRRSYGLIGWTGDVETVRRVALDPEFDPQESA